MLRKTLNEGRKKEIHPKDNQSYRGHTHILQRSTFICGLVKLKVQYVRLVKPVELILKTNRGEHITRVTANLLLPALAQDLETGMGSVG